MKYSFNPLAGIRCFLTVYQLPTGGGKTHIVSIP